MWESVKAERDAFLVRDNTHRFYMSYSNSEGISIERTLTITDEMVVAAPPGVAIDALPILTHLGSLTFMEPEDGKIPEPETLGYLYLLKSRSGVSARLLRLDQPTPKDSPLPDLKPTGSGVYPIPITPRSPEGEGEA